MCVNKLPEFVTEKQHTYTHNHLTTLCPELPGSAGTRKVKPIWILLKQQTVSGSGISWAMCKPAPRSRQTTMPAPHHQHAHDTRASVSGLMALLVLWFLSIKYIHISFLQAGCFSCQPTNSVEALKAYTSTDLVTQKQMVGIFNRHHLSCESNSSTVKPLRHTLADTGRCLKPTDQIKYRPLRG